MYKLKIKLIMKKLAYTFFVLLTIVVFSTSCNKDALKVDVPYEQPSISFQLDSAALQGAKGESVLYSGKVKLNIDSILEAYKAGNISGMKLSYAAILVSPNFPYSLNWLNDLKITVQPEGELETRIAYLNTITPDIILASLNPETIELKDKFNNKEVNIKVYGTMNSPVPIDKLVLELKLKYILAATLL